MSDKQVAMVMDLNKCIGCQTCSIACKRLNSKGEGQEAEWWNSVNTVPGKGTPKNWETMGGGYRNGQPNPGKLPTQQEYGEAWDFDTDEVFFEGNPLATLEPKGGDPEWGPNWDEDEGDGEFPNSYYFYLPRICNHCTKPACMEACPRGAIVKREDGIVLLNEDHCRGHRFCQQACPYKKIYYNAVKGHSNKCLFCAPRIEEGIAPACARQCPGRVRFVGFLDDTEGPIHLLVNKYKVALPLHPEYGTEPNVFYVPPISPPQIVDGKLTGEPRIPPEYLESLFGPEVHGALELINSERERKKNGLDSELMDLLISRKWLDLFGPFTNQPRDVVERKMREAKSQ